MEERRLATLQPNEVVPCAMREKGKGKNGKGKPM
jgi:hypothetical protein